MFVKFSGLDWEVKPVGPGEDAAIRGLPMFQPFVRQRVYLWNCAKQVGAFQVKVNGNNAVALHNLFELVWVRFGLGGIWTDKTKSVEMLLRFLANSTATSLAQARGQMNLTLKVPSKTVPLDKFSNLNPMVSYYIVMHVSHVSLFVHNTKHDLTGYLMIPSRVSFTYEIVNFCDPEAYAKAMKADPKLPLRRETFVVPSRSKLNRDMRHLGLKPMFEESDLPFPIYPLPQQDFHEQPDVDQRKERREEFDAVKPQ